MSNKPSKKNAKATTLSQNELTRCDWCLGQFQAYVDYHDQEWGVENHDDRRHFEFLILEGAQAGLSWATVLKKRAAYRRAFANFDPNRVARFGELEAQQLLANPGLIRNRLKIASAINNAKLFLEIQQEMGSFDTYIWSFVDGKRQLNHWRKMSDVPAQSPASDALAKDLKKRGFKFCGSTIMYAHMQACGLVNDHLISCFRHAQLA